MDDNPMLCAWQGHVRYWSLKVLQPLTPIPVWEPLQHSRHHMRECYFSFCRSGIKSA
ncbi:hypothetical protein M758_UG102800 [Ceratodon purpureus]|nr:hypothetical protein M758_UG102800 [Ceratodon purpureus]